MKWRGMSGVGVQEPLIRGPLLARGPCILLVMVMVQAVTCAHPHHQPPPLTTSTTKLRPERAALTPPTVTSLRPPDRSKNGHDAVEITVRGKHGDSNSPPVVASLSPSGINHPQDPPRPNTQQITPDRPPTAPLATAASGSRAEARPTYSLLDQQHIVPGPATNDVPASRLHGIRPLPSTSSSWDSHRPRYPTHKRLPTSRRVFEPMEDDYALVPMSPEEGGGGLAHKDITAEEGGSGETHNAGWDTMNHSPRISQGRPDTFGHDITEDLTHLQDEYSPRNSQGGITGQTFSTFDETDHSASWATGGDASHILDREYPQESGVRARFDRYYPRQRQFGFPAREYQPGPRITHDSVPEETTTRVHGRESTSRQFPGRILPPAHQITPESYHEGYGSLDYPNSNEFQPRDQGIHNTQSFRTNHNAFITTTSSRRPLSIQEIVKLANLSKIDDLLLLLKRKGIPFRKLLDFVENRATEQDILLFLDKPDISTTPPPATTPWPESDEKSVSDLSFTDEVYNVSVLGNKSYLLTKSSETSLIQSTKFNESSPDNGGGHNTVNSFVPYNSHSQLPAGPEEELNDEGLKQTENDDEERKRKRKRKKEQRDRRRKNRDKKKRQRGRKGQEEADPNLVYTTAILPVDSSKNENGTQFPSPTQVPIWINKSTVALTSTETPRALTVKPLHPLSTVSASPQPPSSKTTLRAVPPPTTPEEKSLSTTSPEAKGRGRDSLTLPPMGKTTKASIENLTVIELPRETDGETVPKYHKPIRRPDHQNPHLDVHRQHKERHRPPKEVFKVPKHISGSTPKQTENEFEGRTNFVREQQKDDYIFPIKGMLIISGVMGALAVFTLVVLISYAVIKCSKKPVVNNYQVSEQKPVTQ
ncbi:uncharacterized protein LOC121879705 isoform X1 [Homarus americanus]|uniref:Uncharacterized protein n=1 Tax=Homarus americanus TaxID=6706 RepID=A0A8J5JLF1_HOMAM|nr:uncharacterized protein LOC121879705 isoform X1 [Homarus americanus]KAG7157690.1 hypothetical protein Hamer_G018752 [Homarus americanus]